MTEDVRPSGTYRTLDEQREVLTPAEQRFEKARQTIGLFLGPLVFLVMYYAPLPLERDQHTLAAILAFVIVYWLSEAIPIPVTAMLGLALVAINLFIYSYVLLGRRRAPQRRLKISSSIN